MGEQWAGDTTKQKQPTWWLQLVSSTAIENHDEMRRKIEAWVTETDKYYVDWDPASPMPASISGYGFADFAPDVDGYLADLQGMLGDHEHMIFSVVLNHAIVDRGGIEIILITPRIIANVNGGELIERARRLVLVSEEELMPSKTS